MPKAKVNDIEIQYETIGNPISKPVLLIAGLGGQLLAWSDEMCENLADHGFFVIRFDHRDIGLSTKLEDAGIPNFVEIREAYYKGEVPKVPYTLEDMADDAIGILDDLNIDKTHVCGASIGGMIALVLTYRHPTRVLSLTLINSTTGDPNLLPPKPEILGQYFAPVPSEREAYIEEMVKRDSLINGTFTYDEKQSRAYRTKEYDRCYYPEGVARQLAATSVPGNLIPFIGTVKAPTLVIHGREDPLHSIKASEDIAAAISGSELMILEKMGHSLPREALPDIIKGLVKNSNKN